MVKNSQSANQSVLFQHSTARYTTLKFVYDIGSCPEIRTCNLWNTSLLPRPLDQGSCPYQIPKLLYICACWKIPKFENPKWAEQHIKLLLKSFDWSVWKYLLPFVDSKIKILKNCFATTLRASNLVWLDWAIFKDFSL